MSTEPRAHLYVFAHRALPTIGLNHAKQMLGALCGPESSRFLASVWQDVGNKIEPKDRMEFPELVRTTQKRNEHLIAMIQFPKPVGVTEPHFSAFVFGPIRGMESLENLTVRYFILEHSQDLVTGGARTVLGEWTKELHINYGDGPPAVAESFENAVWKSAQPK